LKSLAANLSDVDTPGYRQDITSEQSFGQMLLSRLDQRGTAVGPSDLGPASSRPSIDLSNGPLDQTGRPLDAALVGSGFFTVQAPDGLRYTRRGAFHQDSAGKLVSLEGWPVLGTNGPLVGTGAMSISPTGQVVTPGAAVGQLKISTFAAGTNFDRRDGTYLVPADGATPTTITAPQIVPNNLEGSNVDLTSTMTDMLEATRSYQAAQRALVTEDSALSKLIDQANSR
jgi:flagellar basal-body rod protein FlgG